jgi:hypothetical protein
VSHCNDHSVGGLTAETKYAEIDWLRMESSVVSKLGFLRLAWKASERDCSPEAHRQIVRDLYLPLIGLLAQFCNSIDEHEEEKLS